MEDEEKVLKKIIEANKKVDNLYKSKKMDDILVQRRMYLRYSEANIEKDLQPKESVLSQPFTL